MKKKRDPKTLRCSSGKRTGPMVRTAWCYQVARGPKKKFIVQVRGYNGLLIVGYLGPDCHRITNGNKAVPFDTASAADQAAQKCILGTRKAR